MSHLIRKTHLVSTILTAFCLMSATALPVSAQVLLTPYDEGHVIDVPYTVPIPNTTLEELWHVDLDPIDPIFERKPSSNFTNVLQAAFPTWTFDYSHLFTGTDLALSDGSLIVHEYSAIHENQDVGADFSLEYAPHAGDPSGDDVHWIQVVRDNHKLGEPHGTPENAVDNDGASVPYYDAVFPGADSAGFSDDPRREDDMSHFWSAELFLVQEVSDNNGLGGREVFVYDGIQWGWKNNPIELASAPEPGPAALALGFVVGLAAVIVRRRLKGVAS